MKRIWLTVKADEHSMTNTALTFYELHSLRSYLRREMSTLDLRVDKMGMRRLDAKLTTIIEAHTKY